MIVNALWVWNFMLFYNLLSFPYIFHSDFRHHCCVSFVVEMIDAENFVDFNVSIHRSEPNDEWDRQQM